MGSDPLVSLRGFSLARRVPGGERVILEDIDLEVGPGTWLAVLGGNGSGKTSLLTWLAGDASPVADQSAIVLQDPDEQLVAASVDQELALGDPARDVAGLRDDAGLAGRGGTPPRILSAGQKQRLALAVALAQEPRVLLCDEPTALQDPEQAEWVLDRLDRWRHESGGALVTATCDRREAARADEIVVLEDGRIAARGPAADLLESAAVGDLLDPATAPQLAADPAPGGSPVLALAGVVCRFGSGAGALGPLDLEVAPGERVGLVGPNGCGKSTLLAACAGLRPPDEGSIRVGDRRLYARGGTDLDHGRALLAPQFPEYFFTAATAAGELDLDPSLSGLAVDAFLDDLGLPRELGDRNPHALSTGQRRRLALGLVLRAGRSLALLDEPTAALDRAGRAVVLRLLAESGPGTGLVIASHDRALLEAAGCRLVELGAGA